MGAPLHHLRLPRASQAFVSRCADETIDHLSRKLAPHRMDVAEGESVDVEMRSIELGRINIIELGYGADVRIAPAAVEDCYMVHAAVAGSSQVQDRDAGIVLDFDNLHVLSPGQAPIFHLSRSCRHVVVRIPTDILSRQLSTRIGMEAKAMAFVHATTEGSPLCAAWRGLLAHIVDLAECAPGALRGSLGVHYGALLVELLLDLQPSNYYDRLHESGPAICPRHVQRARALIEDSSGARMTMSDLAAAVKVSPRTLQNGFRQFLGMTPGAYARNHRLAMLHAALQKAGPGESVTDIMLAQGIANFGRFAGYYRTRYGCAPSATLRRGARP